MRHRWIPVLIAGVALATPAFALQSGEPAELDTVLVVGEQPGPGLWKVSKEGHVLWILAAHRPLPQDLHWRTTEIEARIAASQEVLYRGNVGIGANIGLLRGLTLVPAALRAAKLPEGRTLEDVLPADTWATWRVLRERYLPKDKDVERLRPAIALERLRSAALRRNGLAGGPDVFEVVGRLRKKHKVKRHALPEARRTLRVGNPRGLLKDAARLEVPELACVVRALGTLEEDVLRERRRAEAWARGDIDTLRRLHRDLDAERALQENCGGQLLQALAAGEGPEAARAKQLLDDALWHARWASVQAENEWLDAARAALEKNASTFAVLPLDDVLRADGPLSRLRAEGYEVEEPR
ncbi:MAG: TraB/GumN family protein [Pseudomonadota bacterium]|jgi:hypothetical protein|nr:MAG: TraB/GumN family protein [Pseudomonadota bacterium]